jgi:uncharacterized protein YutE (UPF0331/DUF86 family)
MTTQELERIKLNEIATEYTSKGYSVNIHPNAEDRPEFLATYEVDLVAQSPKDNVVVEIRSGHSLRNQDIVRIAEAVKDHPDWRFELAVVNPPVAPDVPVYGEIADQAQIQASLRSAETLRNEGQFEAAALIAWAAAEAILRTWARSEGLDLDRKSSSALLKNLYSEGKLEPEVYAKLQDLLEFRNAFAHGFRAKLDHNQLNDLIGEVTRLSAAA